MAFIRLDDGVNNRRDTADHDTIFAFGGDDKLWVGFGNDKVFGGTGNDTILASSGHASGRGALGNDEVYGGAGSDTIDYSRSSSINNLYGDAADVISDTDGIDTIDGGSAKDFIRGGGGGDFLYGNGGDDVIWGDLESNAGSSKDYLNGGAGVDTLIGGGGNDTLVGGTQVDYMAGGTGTDTFKFDVGDTGRTWKSADVIRDFNADKIAFFGKMQGTDTNYEDFSFTASANMTSEARFNKAFDIAAGWLDEEGQYVFVTDGTDGYLFTDFNLNGSIDAAIKFSGLESTSDFHYWYIV